MVPKAKQNLDQHFLKGPIPMKDIAAAAMLPGKALVVFLATHYQTALTGKPTVTIPARLLAELGVSRNAKARALKALEACGLVRVERQKGRTARVSLHTHAEVGGASDPHEAFP